MYRVLDRFQTSGETRPVSIIGPIVLKGRDIFNTTTCNICNIVFLSLSACLTL